MGTRDHFSRRRFISLAAATAAGCATVGKGQRGDQSARHVPSTPRRRSPAASGVVRVGLIGCGARGIEHLRQLRKRAVAGGVRVVAVCDIYGPRKRYARALSNADLHHRWQDLLARRDVDAVVIATPDHWHAPMAIAAMESGKDVYCERPMARDAAQAKAFRNCAERTKRIVQIGVQQTSESQWRVAKALVQDGVVGEVCWSQARYTRNPAVGAWNTPIDHGFSPDTLDWDAFLGDAPKRPFSPERYFRWRKYWDYSNGIATDVLYERLAPLLLTLGAGFPERVSAAGGMYVQDEREVPDSLLVRAEYPGGATIVLAASPANAGNLPAVIRGDKAGLEFLGDHVALLPEGEPSPGPETDGGRDTLHRVPCEERPGHLANWLACVRSRAKCICDEDLGYRTMAGIGMAIEAYRQGKRLEAGDWRLEAGGWAGHRGGS